MHKHYIKIKKWNENALIKIIKIDVTGENVTN